MKNIILLLTNKLKFLLTRNLFSKTVFVKKDVTFKNLKNDNIFKRQKLKIIKQLTVNFCQRFVVRIQMKCRISLKERQFFFVAKKNTILISFLVLEFWEIAKCTNL